MASEAGLKFPEMALVAQTFENTPLADPARTLEDRLDALDLTSRISPGQTVAVTAGSRGVTDMALVIKILVARLKSVGAVPFIVPAMGSHGGATAEGQEKILRDYNVTRESVGAEVRSDMATVCIGETVHGVPVYMDAQAFEADHVVVVNRVKPHTDFEAEIESGLTKMMAVGLGKREGAEIYHNAILDHGYYPTFTSVADVVLEKAPITLGIGIVENQLDRTEAIDLAWAEDIPALDRQLLAKAKTVFPRLPFDQIDLLVVDEMGKDISGTGMDQNVIARTVIRAGTVPDRPEIRRIFVRDLTRASQGTATGLANADFALSRLVDKIDRHGTYTNCICSCEPGLAAIPCHFDTDRETIAAALRTIGLRSPDQARVVHIRNTLHLERMAVSRALLGEAGQGSNLKIIKPPQPMAFDPGGFLILPW